MKNGILKEVVSWILYMGAGILIALFLVNFVFRLTVVKGESMSETLSDNQILYIDKLSYRFSEPKRGDIVVCNYPGQSEKFIKRIVGMPGETIYIKNSVVYINGEAGVDLWNGEHEISDMHSVEIPDGYYFVMGDNRSNSKDSREKSVGSIEREAILGKATLSLYPFDSFGTINFKS